MSEFGIVSIAGTLIIAVGVAIVIYQLRKGSTSEKASSKETDTESQGFASRTVYKGLAIVALGIFILTLGAMTGK